MASVPITQQAKLTADDAAAEDFFGRSVAIDRDTIIIGANHDDNSGSSSGSVYVFTRSGVAWSQQAMLTADDAATDDRFGVSVAIDGDTAIIGAYLDDDDGIDCGSTYIFTRSGAAWSQQAKLTADDAAAGDWFGHSVALDGNTAVIGAYGDDSYSGSTYVFMRSGIVWSQQTKLTANDATANDRFGRSVMIDGDTVVIGAHSNDNGGSAYVFTRSDIMWSQQTKLTANDAAANDRFGWSVAIDGNTAVIGAYRDDSSSGSAYVFTRSNTTWSQQTKLTADDAAADDYFGWSVMIDGEIVVIGAYHNDDHGSAYVFMRSNTTWNQLTKLTADDAAADDYFGESVTINGDTAVIGARFNDDDGSNSGSAYVFAPAPATIYLPVIMKPATITNLTTPAINDTPISPRPVTSPGEVFYIQEVIVASPLPSGGMFYLSSRADTLVPAYVDDEVVIILNGNEIFTYRYGQLGGGVPPALVEVPRSVMEQIAGEVVTFEFRDVYGSVVAASEMYLIWIP